MEVVFAVVATWALFATYQWIVWRRETLKLVAEINDRAGQLLRATEFALKIHEMCYEINRWPPHLRDAFLGTPEAKRFADLLKEVRESQP